MNRAAREVKRNWKRIQKFATWSNQIAGGRESGTEDLDPLWVGYQENEGQGMDVKVQTPSEDDKKISAELLKTKPSYNSIIKLVQHD